MRIPGIWICKTRGGSYKAHAAPTLTCSAARRWANDNRASDLWLVTSQDDLKRTGCPPYVVVRPSGRRLMDQRAWG